MMEGQPHALFHLSILCLLICICSVGIIAQDENEDKSKETSFRMKEQLKSMKLPPCSACKNLVDSFKKGMTLTSRGKFDGGDAAWEEEKMKKYSKSEVRLVEIQEKLCTDVGKAEDQCHTLADEHESQIEDWWFNEQDNTPDIYDWLCINTLRVCCPSGHYGQECTPCNGHPDNICNNSGKCKGDGTRKGNGRCVCDKAYAGDYCNECSSGYCESYRDEVKLLCTKCHHSCDGNCTKAGPEGCITCNPGWLMSDDNVCQDIDECLVRRSPCTANQFCINAEGSYACYACDRSCDGCTGDGPDMCIKCAEGHTNIENMCIDDSAESRKTQASTSRYVTYFGLCVATCIIFQKNIYVAGVVGISVAAYISVSEYILKITPPGQLSGKLIPSL